MDEAIQNADELMALISGDKEMRRAYWRHQMILSDYTSEMNYAHDDGLKQGLEQGREEERHRVLGLLDRGLSAEEIKQRLMNN